MTIFVPVQIFMLHMKMQSRSGMHENAKTDSAGWLVGDKKKLHPAPKSQNTRPWETTKNKPRDTTPRLCLRPEAYFDVIS